MMKITRAEQKNVNKTARVVGGIAVVQMYRYALKDSEAIGLW